MGEIQRAKGICVFLRSFMLYEGLWELVLRLYLRILSNGRHSGGSLVEKWFENYGMR